MSSKRITLRCTPLFTAKGNVRSIIVHRAPPCAFRRGLSALFDLPGSARRPRWERRPAFLDFVSGSPITVRRASLWAVRSAFRGSGVFVGPPPPICVPRRAEEPLEARPLMPPCHPARPPVDQSDADPVPSSYLRRPLQLAERCEERRGTPQANTSEKREGAWCEGVCSRAGPTGVTLSETLRSEL